jgi:dihydrofolate synthase/folylpolyglutamate synthase
MLDAILRTAGRRVGLYTSPHLVKLGERVQVDRTILSEDEIVAYAQELQPVAERLAEQNPEDHPSFFEFMTAMAFQQFVRKGCDIAVVEVGLGGELDATNIVRPAITAITSIGLDHCDILGNSHAEIARAKAGILKAGVPVVIGRLPDEAEVVVRQRAAELEIPVISVREHYGEELANYPETALEGDCQRWNAATASLIVRTLLPELDKETITRGLNSAQWPARWQAIEWQGRHLILDSSHNPEGAEELKLNLARLQERIGHKPKVVVGALGGARARPLLEAVAQFAQNITLVVPAQARACSHEDLHRHIPGEFRGEISHGRVEELFGQQALLEQTQEGETVVITGSIYLAGEVLALLKPEDGANEGHLQDF